MQEKIPDKDLSRILKGVGLIALGSGKIAGAVGLAVISAPFCVAGIGVGGEIAAGIVSASGGGDIAQGIYEIAYGWNGDSESTSFNLVRDTLYSGNEKAYHVSTGTAAACGQVGQGIAAMEAAKKAAEKELAEQMAKEAAKESKEVVEEVVKKNADDVIEEAVGQNADDILEETEKLYDDIFDQYYKEQFDPIGEKAIAQPDSVGYKSGTPSTTAGFDDWLGKGATDNKVYFGMKDGTAQYTGITKQTKNARLNQHNNAGKGFDDLDIQYEGLTRNQARAIEQYYIENGPNALNKINSISPNNKYYQDAMNWAKQYLGVE